MTIGRNGRRHHSYSVVGGTIAPSEGLQDAGKPFAAICHAPWELVLAGLVRGRRLTSYYTIQDDVRNAGGRWVDREVVEDGNWLTSCQLGDLPAFNRAMLALFSHALVPGGK